MRFWSLAVSSLLLSYVASSQAEVKVLTGDNFDSALDGSVPALVEFYAPWCGHCQRLAPEYEIVGEAFKSLSSQVVVGKVDCDEHKEICNKQGVSGYPTLKWFPQGDVQNPEDFQGERTADGIIKYINDKTGLNGRVKKAPSAVVVLDDNYFDEVVLDSNKDVFVEFYAPWCGHCKRLAPEWEKLAHAFQSEESVVIAKYDADSNKKFGSKYGVSGFPTLVYFPKDNKEGEKYEGGRTIQDLVDYINTEAHTSRQANGRYQPGFGRIASVDEHLKNGDLSAAKQAAKGLTEKHADLYAKLIEKAEKDASYAEKEIVRLQKLIDGGSVTPKKIDEFTIRLHILQAINKQ